MTIEIHFKNGSMLRLRGVAEFVVRRSPITDGISSLSWTTRKRRWWHRLLFMRTDQLLDIDIPSIAAVVRAK